MTATAFALGIAILASGAPAAPFVDARAELDLMLFDYPSARFMDVRARVGSSGVPVYCGYVNSKNRMGAYAGWKRILIFPTAESVVSIDDFVAETICESQTTSPSGPDLSDRVAFKPRR